MNERAIDERKRKRSWETWQIDCGRRDDGRKRAGKPVH